MTTRMFFRLILLVAALSVIAYVLNRQPGKETIDGFAAGDKVFKAIDVNDVEHIEVSSPFATSVISRTESGWVADSLYGYPVKFSQVAGLLRIIHDVEVGQIVRGGERMREELGLVATEGNFDYTRIVLNQKGGNEPVALTLGSLKHQPDATGMGMGIPQGRFIQVGDGPVLQVDEVFTGALPRSEEWIELDILKVPPESIVRVAVENGDQSFTLHRDGDAGYIMDDASAEEAVDQSAATTLFQGLQWLRVNSVVAPDVTDEAIGLDSPAQASFITRDEIVYTLRFGDDDQVNMVRPVRIVMEIPEDNGSVDAEMLKQQELFAQWRYMIPSRRADQILPLRDALLVKRIDDSGE